jgi:6-phosphogluconolactonase (cycloisomerase 2 family)
VHHVTLSPDGRFLYAATGAFKNPPDDDGALAIFRRDARTGALTQLPGKAGCVKREASHWGQEGCAGGRAMQAERFVTVSADGRFLYSGGAQGIAVFRRDVETGNVRQLPGPAGCLAEDPSLPCAHVAGVSTVEDIVLTRDQRFVYVVNLNGHAVLLFRRNPRTGTLSVVADRSGCLARDPGGVDRPCRHGRTLRRPRSLTLSPDQRFAYVSAIANDALLVFKRDPATGVLSQLPGTAGCLTGVSVDGCTAVRGLRGTHRLTITANGRFAYAAGKRDQTGGGGSSVVAFRRDPKTGALTELAGAAGCLTEDDLDGCQVSRSIEGAHAVMFDATEQTAYVSTDRTGIAVLRRDRKTGRLSQLPGAYGCVDDPKVNQETTCTPARRAAYDHFLVLSGDGRFAYVAGENSSAVLVFRVAK